MRRRVILVLLIMAILLFSSGITYSLFTSGNSLASTDQNIAKFIFNTDSLDELEIPLIDLNPGDEEEYTFSISNNLLENISDVSIEYKLTIKTYRTVPLDIVLYKIVDDTEELLLICDDTYTYNSSHELVCNTEMQSMIHSEEQLDTYKLKITFPSEYNSVIYSDLVDYINIEIDSFQVLDDKKVKEEM